MFPWLPRLACLLLPSCRFPPSFVVGQPGPYPRKRVIKDISGDVGTILPMKNLLMLPVVFDPCRVQTYPLFPGRKTTTAWLRNMTAAFSLLGVGNDPSCVHDSHLVPPSSSTAEVFARAPSPEIVTTEHPNEPGQIPPNLCTELMHVDSSRRCLEIRASAKRRAGDPQHSAIAELNGFGAVERSFDAVLRWVS
ncbi:uncharacterized protein P884DRAFT_267397 [Thermothelomyces heterothallicus CBS 202.75]|uniref:uncharacterized protein n=1 Tax=Thermothelomyces heterothallicus CBS 202.75 TaxID=1149848 RepID=UPI0037444DFE